MFASIITQDCLLLYTENLTLPVHLRLLMFAWFQCALLNSVRRALTSYSCIILFSIMSSNSDLDKCYVVRSTDAVHYATSNTLSQSSAILNGWEMAKSGTTYHFQMIWATLWARRTHSTSWMKVVITRNNHLLSSRVKAETSYQVLHFIRWARYAHMLVTLGSSKIPLPVTICMHFQTDAHFTHHMK